MVSLATLYSPVAGQEIKAIHVSSLTAVLEGSGAHETSFVGPPSNATAWAVRVQTQDATNGRIFQANSSAGSELFRVDRNGPQGVFRDNGGAVVNVKNTTYGATGDGSTNDSAAINSAIASLSSGTVFIPPGTYNLSATSINLKSNVQLVGAGIGVTILSMSSATASGVHAMTGTAGIQNVRIADLTIEGNRGSGTSGTSVGAAGNGIQITGSSPVDYSTDPVGTLVDIERVRVQNWAGIGIALLGVRKYTIRDSQVYNGGYHGIWLGWVTSATTANYSRDGTVSGCLVDSTWGDGIETFRHSRIENTRIYKSGLGFPTGSSGYGSGGGAGGGASGIFLLGNSATHQAHDNVLAHNWIEDCTASGIDIGVWASNNVITGNFSWGNSYAGISVAGSYNAVTGNICRANGDWGGSVNQIALTDGIVLGGPGGATQVFANVVTGNLCDENARYGIALHDSTTASSGYGTCPVNNVIVGNQVRANDVGNGTGAYGLTSGIHVPSLTVDNVIGPNSQGGTAPAVERAAWAGVKLVLGTATNANQTGVGLTIAQGTADDEILTLKSSDIAHGVTDVTETDSFGVFQKNVAANGGLLITGLDDAANIGLRLRGVTTTANSTRALTAVGAVIVDAYLKNGTGVTTLGANGNICVFRDNGSAQALFDVEGDLHLNATVTASSWDAYDDLALLEAYRLTTAPGIDFKARFAERVDEYAQVLADTGVLRRNADGSTFVSLKGTFGLVIDAVRQVAARVETVEKRLAALPPGLIREEE